MLPPNKNPSSMIYVCNKCTNSNYLLKFQILFLFTVWYIVFPCSYIALKPVTCVAITLLRCVDIEGGQGQMGYDNIQATEVHSIALYRISLPQAHSHTKPYTNGNNFLSFECTKWGSVDKNKTEVAQWCPIRSITTVHLERKRENLPAPCRDFSHDTALSDEPV